MLLAAPVPSRPDAIMRTGVIQPGPLDFYAPYQVAENFARVGGMQPLMGAVLGRVDEVIRTAVLDPSAWNEDPTRMVTEILKSFRQVGQVMQEPPPEELARVAASTAAAMGYGIQFQFPYPIADPRMVPWAEALRRGESITITSQGRTISVVPRVGMVELSGGR